jgi:hypothetical protein
MQVARCRNEGVKLAGTGIKEGVKNEQMNNRII